jgi:hypothetical protein
MRKPSGVRRADRSTYTSFSNDQFLRIGFFCSRLRAMTGRGNELFVANHRGRWGTALWLALTSLSLSSAGCEPKEDTYGCKPITPTGEAKPGDITGDWEISQSSEFCTAQYDRVVSNDWCSQLVWDANGVRQVYLGHPWLSVNTKSLSGAPSGLTLNADEMPDPNDPSKMITEKTYRSDLPFGPSAATTTFPRACLTAYGQPGDSCGDFQKALIKYVGYNSAEPDKGDKGSAWQSFNLLSLQFQPNYPQGLVPAPGYSGITCLPATSAGGGCTCTYNVSLDIHDTGTWTNERGTILSLYSDSATLPYDTDYATDGTILGMSGHDGFDLLGQRGLRRLTWTRP